MLESLNKSVGGNMANFISEDSMKQYGLMSVFSEGPNTPGKSWTNEMTTKNPVLGSQVVTTTFRYKGTETRDGKVLDKIDLSMTIKPEAKKSEGESKTSEGEAKKPEGEAKKPEGEAKEGEKKVETGGFNASDGKGFLLFDNAAGRVVESTMEMKMKLDISVMGQKITQDMNMKMRMTPRRPKLGPLRRRRKRNDA